jgi:hypothetical protein
MARNDAGLFIGAVASIRCPDRCHPEPKVKDLGVTRSGIPHFVRDDADVLG